jgi:tetratricopeptide (TPR) repeat protein
MLRRALILLPLVACGLLPLVACGHRDEAPPAPTPPTPIVAPARDAATIPDDPIAGKRHLTRGRALGREKRWQDAHAELAAGCESSPGSPALWCELSWSSLMLADFARAQHEAEQAVATSRAAKDRRREAAALYNLGRATEGAGDREGARGHYAASLAIRPSDIVANRLERLTRPTMTCDDPDPIDCVTGPAAKVCDCLTHFAAGLSDQDPDDESPSPPGGAPSCAALAHLDLEAGAKLELWRVGWSDRPEDQTGAYLVSVDREQVTALATIANGLDGGHHWARRLTPGKLELRTAGDVRYLYATATVEAVDEPVVGEEVTETIEAAHVCPLAPQPRCTLRVPLRNTLHARLDPAAIPEPDGERRRLEFERMWGHRSPYAHTRTLAVAIAPDGAAVVTPDGKTAADDVTEWVGSYRAW